MTDSYEYYGTFDSDAKEEIDLDEQVRDWLWTTDLMIEFVSSHKRDILESFLKRVETKYSNEVNETSSTINECLLGILDDTSILTSHSRLKELSLRIIMKYIPLDGITLTEEKIPVRFVDFLRAKHILLYHRITSLVELLGRKEGIDFFKDFVQYWGSEVGKTKSWPTTLKEARVQFVKYWKESGGFDFGVRDIDENMFLAKFDKCVWFESMKHIDDQELAYYAVCYPGPRIGRYAHQNIRMRRSVTLFTGDFCDELRWDRHVHDEPEQPTHEFSRGIVPK